MVLVEPRKRGGGDDWFELGGKPKLGDKIFNEVLRNFFTYSLGFWGFL